MQEKRKTTTSSEIKHRYNNKVYATVRAELPKDLVNEFKEICKEKNISQASVLKSSIEKFIEENK